MIPYPEPRVTQDARRIIDLLQHHLALPDLTCKVLVFLFIIKHRREDPAWRRRWNIARIWCSSPVRRQRGLVADGDRTPTESGMRFICRGVRLEAFEGDTVRVSSDSIQGFGGLLTRLQTQILTMI